MPEIAHITYEHNNSIPEYDNLGMRLMQRKAYERRNEQYILLKAPPASGKSRACMYIALDKLHFQGLKKVIIAVPEKTIASSFKDTDLRTGGFFTDWSVDKRYNLCIGGSDSSKVAKVRAFLKDPGAQILLCTHATLRFAYDDLKNDMAFNDCFLCIDEFHHTSADVDNSRLGNLIANIYNNSTAHILAMTGSYFRGNGVAVLDPEVEGGFTSVTYTYYEQLSSYKYLNTINLSYDFYAGTYFDVLKKDLNLNKKAIIHIPNINSRESTKAKYNEVDTILDIIGDVEEQEEETGVYLVRTKEGRLLRVVDLVEDDPKERAKREKYVRENADKHDALDIIIALNLAKEGFDWPACEHMLTVGYRGSLTEIVQIIGRCTRDYPGKTEATFTNIIAEPDSTATETAEAVNNLLKAVTASLLMEQVLAPKWDFKTKMPKLQLLKPETEKAQKIIDNEMSDLIASIMTNPEVQKVMMKKNSARLINKGLVPKILIEKYSGLSATDREAIRQEVVSQLVIGSAKTDDDDNKQGPNSAPLDKRLLKFADGLIVDIRELDINLIDSINPFEKAYQIIAKSIDKETLATIKDAIDKQMHRLPDFTENDIKIYWPQIIAFNEENGRIPDRLSEDPYEARLGEVLVFLAREKERMNNAK